MSAVKTPNIKIRKSYTRFGDICKVPSVRKQHPSRLYHRLINQSHKRLKDYFGTKPFAAFNDKTEEDDLLINFFNFSQDIKQINKEDFDIIVADKFTVTTTTPKFSNISFEVDSKKEERRLFSSKEDKLDLKTFIKNSYKAYRSNFQGGKTERKERRKVGKENHLTTDLKVTNS